MELKDVAIDGISRGTFGVGCTVEFGAVRSHLVSRPFTASSAPWTRCHSYKTLFLVALLLVA